MTFSESISKCLNNYANFSGRASRSEFWWFYLFNVIVSIVASIIGAIFASLIGSEWIGTALVWLCSLALLLPNLAVAVRRLHDLGKGGGWIFIGLIPLVGGIWLLVLFLTASEPGENRFGYPEA